MKRFFLLLVLLIPVIHVALAQADTVTRRIVLIGDAGQLTNGRHPVVDAVKKNIRLDKKTTVVFLGDNLYKSGLPDIQYKAYAKARAVLDSQLSVADNTPAKVFMIPGNHDWENGGRGGYNAILRQQLYVDFLDKDNVEFQPKDGCPGPKEEDLGNGVLLVMFDSQWWLHPHDKPEIESDCKCKTKDELVAQIGDIVARNPEKLVILACHHPFKSNGVHGGYFTLKQHLFPLTDLKKNLYIPMPVIGSAYPIARSVFGAPQDISYPAYTDMINKITSAVRRSSPNVIFVSGHDHNLQLIREDGYNYVISGGGCKQNRTSNNKNSLFNARAEGFAVMEVFASKEVKIRYYTIEDSLRESETFSLLNYSKLPEAFTDTTQKASIVAETDYPDSVSAAINTDFTPIKGLKKYFMGQNYRKEWATPVNMKIFQLLREKGGFTIDGLGGGGQTKSLHLINKQTGEDWVLRLMNKSPSQTIPEIYRGPVVEDLVTELKSSTFPYGAFVVPHLASSLSLFSASPELFYVPDDPALSFYRPLFANTVCMLERRNASFTKTETRSTAKMIEKILEENDHRPVQSDVLRARLLDIVIADYDRHFDQWRWGTIDTGKGKLYYPVPRDRDQSFFNSDGRMLRFLSGRTLPFLKGFRPDIPKVNWLGYVARDFDRLFLTDLDQREWENIIDTVQQNLTDSVIHYAVRQLPPEIYPISGEKIISKLISRRNVLKDAAMKYYRFISKQVNIVGSNQKEYFKVSSVGNLLRVKLYARSKGNDTSFVMYDRLFDPAVTKEIRLFGLNDEDVFEVDKNANTKIRLRIIGGRGIDTFNIKGQVQTFLYDLKDDAGNDFYILDSSHIKRRFSNDPPVNDKTILGFNYSNTRFPRLHFNYNADDGMLLGAGFSHRTYGFRNYPYATDQYLSAIYAVDRRGIRLQYRGEFNHVLRKADLLVKADFASPSLNNFFGLGNNSRIDPSLPRRYYQTLFQSFEGQILLRKRAANILQLLVGPYLYSYSARYQRNEDNVLAKPSQVRLDSAAVFGKKMYGGARFGFVIDNRNKEFFPTRGIFWRHDILATTNLRTGEGKYFAYITDMSLYASLREAAKLVTVLKFGGGRILSKNYEYFQAMSFGAQNDLPGFRKNRYAGRSSMYAGIEFRAQLFNINSYILPGPFGVAAFYNAGKVWQPNEINGTKKWHGAYGFGVYYLPFSMFSISAYAGYSESEKMFNFTLGTKFNLTY